MILCRDVAFSNNPIIYSSLLKQLSKYIQLITKIEGFKFGNGLVRNFDKNRGRVGNTDRGRVGNTDRGRVGLQTARRGSFRGSV